MLRHFLDDVKVAFNYHLYFPVDKHYYSVPYGYRTKRVRVAWTEIEILWNNRRIACHRRERAAQVGPATQTLIHAILNARRVPEQSFRSCKGLEAQPAGAPPVMSVSEHPNLRGPEYYASQPARSAS